MCECEIIKEEITKFKSDEYSERLNISGIYTSLHMIAIPNEEHNNFVWKIVAYGDDTAESDPISYCPFCGKKL